MTICRMPLSYLTDGIQVSQVELSRNLQIYQKSAFQGFRESCFLRGTMPSRKGKAAGHWLLLAHVHCRNLVVERGQGPVAGKALCPTGPGHWKAEHAAGVSGVSAMESRSKNTFFL